MDVIFPAANSNTVKLFYSKRNSSMELRRSALGRQTLWNGSSSSIHPPPCNDKFEVGAFYEIDHGKLPPKSPIQLKALRIVKVRERRKMDLTVSFPSTYSLRNYFSAKAAGDRIPELDEKFVMSYNYAERILRRKIPASQLEMERHQQRFWLVDPSVLLGESEAEDEDKPPASGCLMILKSSGLLEWGIRRRVKYIGRHRGTPPPMPVSAPAVKKDGEEEAEEEDEEEGEEEEEGEQMAMGDQQQENENSSGRKRTRDACKKDIKKNKGKKVGRRKKKKRNNEKDTSKKKPRLDIVKVNNPEDSRRERWSTERYESAELKLLDIMRAKGAEIGNPILRQELRVEARKHIGDTGLLDHLLKHMAGKVIAQGSDRFRRRHNAEGAMEYWLEPAELMEIRKDAGVADPYWVPPPGWKLGDATSLCACGAECKKETNRLSAELEMMKRDVDQLRSLKQQLEKEGRDASAAAKADAGIVQEKYEKLLKMNAKMEAEMARFVGCMETLKEEVKMLREEKENRDNKAMEVAMEEAATDAADGGGDKKMITEPNASTNNSSTTTAGDKINDNGEAILMVPAGKKVAGVGGRRSGFRICKPQGTFLWPNMGSTTRGGGAQAQGIQLQVVPTNNNNNNNNNQKVSCTFVENHHHYHHQQQLMLFGGAAAAAACSTLSGGIPPTPPSSSSTATSAPKLLLLPSPTTPTSPSLMMVPPPPPPQPPHNNTYSHMPRASTSSMEYCGGGGKKSSAEKAAVANWKKQDGSSNIATDLVLATPSLFP